MAHRIRLVTVALSTMGLLVSCQNEQCEAGRLQVESTWEEVRDTAASLKEPRAFEETDSHTKHMRMKAWSKIAQQAETVRSSFETTNVTWTAADRARDELVTEYNQADPAVKEGVVARGFGNLVASADERTGAYQAQCK